MSTFYPQNALVDRGFCGEAQISKLEADLTNALEVAKVAEAAATNATAMVAKQVPLEEYGRCLCISEKKIQNTCRIL